MSKFLANDAIVVTIIVGGQQVAVPGIACADSYWGTRSNRHTGATIPTEYVDAITFHDIPADQSRSGEARTYYKRAPQSAAFTELRTEAVPAIDDLTADELLAKVAASLAAIQQQTVRSRAAMAESTADAVRPKAVFGGAAAPSPAAQAAATTKQPAAASAK